MSSTLGTSGDARTLSDRFSTDEVAERDRFAMWCEGICTYLSPIEGRRVARDQPFFGQLEQVRVGKVSICEISFSPVLNFRDHACIRRKPDDDLFIAVMKEGSGRLKQNGRCASPHAGDAIIYDSARPFEWEFDCNTRMTIARLSRDHITAHLPEVERLVARVMSRDHPLTSILDSTIDNIRKFKGQNHASAQRFSLSLINALSTTIEAILLAPDDHAGDDDLVRTAKAYVLDNLEDPEMSLHKLTSHLGISVRTLCRAFAREDTTAIRWLWQQRLQLAFRLLKDGQVRSVSQVAMQCGFSDFSHFSRSFKRFHGTSPKLVLRNARIN